MYNKITQLDEQHVVADYANMSTRALQAKYGFERKTIVRILKRNGVTIKNTGIKPNVVKAILTNWVDMPLRHMSVKYSISINAIKRILRSNNLPTNTYGLARVVHKDIFLDKTSPIAAYWAGFLMADGCMTDNRRLCLKLSVKDHNHLLAFVDSMGIDRKHILTGKHIRPVIGTVYNYVEVRMTITAQLKEALQDYGIVPRKTYNFVPPQVASDMLRHYIRGWIDGDGTVKLGKSGYFMLRIVGNNEAMAWLSKAFTSLGYTGHTNIHKRREDDVYSILAVERKLDVVQLVKLLTKPDDLKLERKWVGLDELDTVKYNVTQIPDSVRRDCVCMLDIGYTPADLAGMFGVNFETVRRWQYKYMPKAA